MFIHGLLPQAVYYILLWETQDVECLDAIHLGFLYAAEVRQQFNLSRKGPNSELLMSRVALFSETVVLRRSTQGLLI